MDTITRRDKPSAASHAANTSRIIGSMLARVKCVVKMVTVIITNRDSIMPSRQRREDIMWDRYINRPIREIVNAKNMFI